MGAATTTVTTYSSAWSDSKFFGRTIAQSNHYDNLVKPDLVAPGNKIIGAGAPNNLLLASHPELDANVSQLTTKRMMYLSGSSMLCQLPPERRRCCYRPILI